MDKLALEQNFSRKILFPLPIIDPFVLHINLHVVQGTET
jgi:hypothetical protein